MPSLRLPAAAHLLLPALGVALLTSGARQGSAQPFPVPEEGTAAYTRRDVSPDVRADREGNLIFRNRSLVAVLRKSDEGFGRLEFFPASRSTKPAAARVAEVPVMADVRWRQGGETRSGVFQPRQARVVRGNRLELTGPVVGKDGATSALRVRAELWIGPEAWLSWEVRLEASEPLEVVQLRGLPLRVPTEADSEVLFPGQVLHGGAQGLGEFRLLPDPYQVTVPLMAVTRGETTVAMLWDQKQTWGGEGYPAAMLAGAGDAYRLELMLPRHAPFNKTGAEPDGEPLPLAARKEVKLQGKIAVVPEQPEPAGAIREWVRAFGSPITHGRPRKLEQQRALMRQVYSRTLWRPGAPGWLRIGGEADQRAEARPFPVLALLMEADRAERGEEREALHGIAEMGLDVLRSRGQVPPELAYRTGGVLESLGKERERIDEILFRQQANGSWPPVEGRPDNAGNVLQHALPLLRFAALTGDSEVGAAGLKALRFLERHYRFPAGPTGDTPMLQIATQAAEAYLLAYEVNGEAVYLNLARRWADLGLAYVYFWGEKERPALLHAAIPSMTALTPEPLRPPRYSIPAQADGLELARVLRRLSRVRHDGLYDFVSEGISASAQWQQVATGPETGLLPSGWLLREGKGHGFNVAPDGIYRLISVLDGLDTEVGRARVRVGPDRLTVSTGATILSTATTATRLRMQMRWVDRAETYTAIFGVRSRPVSVQFNSSGLRRLGLPVRRPFLAETDRPDESGWWYDEERELLMLRLRHHGPRDDLEIRWPDPKDRERVIR